MCFSPTLAFVVVRTTCSMPAARTHPWSSSFRGRSWTTPQLATTTTTRLYAEPDEEGANLAAEFFRMAQQKGIDLNVQDLLQDDDDDEEEEEEEEEEPNIPQGAINAFLGYETTNQAGDRLAGNVTLSDRQLYSEVKDRVLDTAGGFVEFVTGAQDDEDEEADENEDEGMAYAGGGGGDPMAEPLVPESKPYVPPTTVPDPELTAGEVVLLVLEALRHNDLPTRNKGVEILFGYSSPGSSIRNEVGLTPE